MKSPNRLLVVAFLLLSGCSDKLVSSLLAPTSSISLAVPQGTTGERAFACFEAGLGTLNKRYGDWDKLPTKQRNPLSRVTGGYESSLGQGFKARFTLDASPPTGATLTVKALGAYFHDIGSKPAAEELAGLIRLCLDGKPQPAPDASYRLIQG